MSQPPYKGVQGGQGKGCKGVKERGLYRGVRCHRKQGEQLAVKDGQVRTMPAIIAAFYHHLKMEFDFVYFSQSISGFVPSKQQRTAPNCTLAN